MRITYSGKSSLSFWIFLSLFFVLPPTWADSHVRIVRVSSLARLVPASVLRRLFLGKPMEQSLEQEIGNPRRAVPLPDRRDVKDMHAGSAA